MQTGMHKALLLSLVFGILQRCSAPILYNFIYSAYLYQNHTMFYLMRLVSLVKMMMMMDKERTAATTTLSLAMSLVLLTTVITTIGAGGSAVFGQTSSTQALPSLPTTFLPDGTFQSIEDGFKLKVPIGWAVKDVDNTIPVGQAAEKSLGFTFLA